MTVVTSFDALPPIWRTLAERRLPDLEARFGKKQAEAVLDLEIRARRRAAAIAGDEAAMAAGIAFQRAPGNRGVRVAVMFDDALIPPERQAATAAAERLSEGLGPRKWRHPRTGRA